MTEPRPIDALIIGAQKAGTSSLAHYLEQHPAICSHHRMELSTFVDDRDYDLGYEANFRRYFGHCPPDALLLGKSVTIMTERRIVERVRDHNPDARLIAIVRNPVDRAYSAYWWARQNGYESLPTFEAALDADPARHRGNLAAIRSTSYIAFGRYADQIEMVRAVVGPDHLQVHLSDDLAADTAGVCRRSFEFLGVDPGVRVEVGKRENAASNPKSSWLANALSAEWRWKRAVRRAIPGDVADRARQRLKELNRSSFVPPPMALATRARLVELFEPENARLGELLGRDLSGWNRAAVRQAERDPAALADRAAS
ncbi:MAG TPA: sulfotransferase domain-containing protein [Candidatus Limnocylindrales bacterium]